MKIERFATKVLLGIAIATIIFILLQYYSYLKTGMEQSILIEWYFRAVVIELGVMMAKRITEVITARIKKKEDIDIDSNINNNPNMY